MNCTPRDVVRVCNYLDTMRREIKKEGKRGSCDDYYKVPDEEFKKLVNYYYLNLFLVPTVLAVKHPELYKELKNNTQLEKRP